MIYLYAGLGIAMISGISAMMQLGVNLISIERVFPLKDKSYDEKYARYDKEIMKILYTQTVPDRDICDYIKDNYKTPMYKTPKVFKENNFKATFSKGKLFADACALESSLPDEDKHRVLIIPKVGEEYKYGLFSCIIGSKDKKENNEIYCDFERNPEKKEGAL